MRTLRDWARVIALTVASTCLGCVHALPDVTQDLTHGQKRAVAIIGYTVEPIETVAIANPAGAYASLQKQLADSGLFAVVDENAMLGSTSYQRLAQEHSFSLIAARPTTPGRLLPVSGASSSREVLSALAHDANADVLLDLHFKPSWRPGMTTGQIDMDVQAFGFDAAGNRIWYDRFVTPSIQFDRFAADAQVAVQTVAAQALEQSGSTLMLRLRGARVRR